MNTYYVGRSSRGVPIALHIAMGHWLFDVLMTRCSWRSNGYPVRLCHPYMREAHDPLQREEQQVPRFGLDRLATASMANQGWPKVP